MKGFLISDFNAENFGAILRAKGRAEGLQVEVAPFGQVEMVLMNEALPAWQSGLDFAVIWTRPEAVLPSFGEALRGERPSLAALDAEVDAFAAAVLAVQDRSRTTFVTDWVLPPFHSGQGMLSLAESGIGRLLLQANSRLLDRLDSARSVIVLSSAKWFQTVGQDAYSPRMWYTAKVPFSNELFKEAAQDVRSALLGLAGRARKLVILDLDDTLWGGIVGDVGWEQLALGGHDAAAEAYADFQEQLLTLTRRGIVLGIASKNDEQVALAAIDNHPEMVLRRENFAGWRINWGDKAENIRALTESLNLGLDAVVFIDDNPMERGRVREALPDVLVPEWPSDPRLYVQALLRLDCFNSPALTDEDHQRTAMYASERERSSIAQKTGSLADWLRALEVTVTVEELSATNLSRATQLLNKTNQFNLSTRRLTEHELRIWADEPARALWTFRVADRFGDSGLTGLLSAERSGNEVFIRDYVLSCRVFGRSVEDTMLRTVLEWARGEQGTSVIAEYVPTAKNKPCLEFLQRAAAAADQKEVFRWDSAAPLPECPDITVRWGGLGGREPEVPLAS